MDNVDFPHQNCATGDFKFGYQPEASLYEIMEGSNHVVTDESCSKLMGGDDQIPTPRMVPQ